MKKFIQYLDTYKNNTVITETEYMNIIHQINVNYLTNQLGGHTSPYYYFPVYYPIQPSLNPIENTSYYQWQQTHEAILPTEDILYYPIKKIIQPIQKEKKSIDANIQSIKDILTIVSENEYNPLYEYNIDLQSLHNIKDELEKIDAMIGLESFKQSVLDQLLYFIQHLHMGKESDYKHTVLCGPPGTGKTEIAKLLGLMYSKLGFLKNNVFQKVTRSDLIAGYLGQTAIKTQKVIEKSLGGVLFIDEAYALGEYSQNDSFSKECIDTICEALSNYKDDLMVIIAGYEEELNETFFKMNRGLDSRFIWRFSIEPYSSKEMKQIFVKKVLDNEWGFENIDEIAEKWFEKKKDSFRYFGRDMEVLFTYIKIVHGRRIYGKSNEFRKKISMDDLEKGYKLFVKNKNVKPQNMVFKNMYI